MSKNRLKLTKTRKNSKMVLNRQCAQKTPKKSRYFLGGCAEKTEIWPPKWPIWTILGPFLDPFLEAVFGQWRVDPLVGQKLPIWSNASFVLVRKSQKVARRGKKGGQKVVKNGPLPKNPKFDVFRMYRNSSKCVDFADFLRSRKSSKFRP